MGIVIQGRLNLPARVRVASCFNQRGSKIVVRGRGTGDRLPIEQRLLRIIRPRETQVVACNGRLRIDLERAAEGFGGFRLSALLEQTIAKVVQQIVPVWRKCESFAMGLFTSLRIVRFVAQNSQPCPDLYFAHVGRGEFCKYIGPFSWSFLIAQHLRQCDMRFNRVGRALACHTAVLERDIGESLLLKMAGESEACVYVRWICVNARPQKSGLQISFTGVHRIRHLLPIYRRDSGDRVRDVRALDCAIARDSHR